MKRRYLIIGSGAAGVTAAEALLRSDPGGEICLVSGDRYGYYSRPGLAYFLSKEIDEGQLFPQRLKSGLTHLTGTAARIESDRHVLHLQDGRAIPYDRLLLAPGATAVMPDLPGIHLEGVVKLDHLEDAQHIIKLARRGVAAVVVGGGITALELVEGLAARGMKVHYLLRGDRYWSNVLDPIESEMVAQRLKEEGVQLHTEVQVSEILGKQQVEGVRTQAGAIIPCRLAAFAVGIRPRLELARTSGLNVKRGILTDAYLQTSATDIFAAGDAAEVIDPLNGESIMESLWNPARQQGQIAGCNMAGGSQAYQRTSGVNVTRLAGMVTTIIGQVGQPKASPDRDLKGIMHGDSESWRQVTDAMIARNYSQAYRVRLFVGEHALRGALLMGEQTLSRPLQHLIENKVDIAPIRAALLNPEADLLQIIRGYDQKVLLTMANHIDGCS